MIKILYKECCQNCGHLDIDYETDEIRIMTGEKQISACIGCSHMKVCKSYLEEKKNSVIPELPRGNINIHCEMDEKK